ncbi:hypothetical protein G7K_6493-t1 [Saitoella complicata NRRL Y-17804]|uniref:Uncharacterized protein n=1 Tax=Saitoella complicata (strain BCRC 22490 / CBS 7301 / JCM 7358 / NBRC 10748 / NRRL Y-17804) TaxID=698492 RepID=A0A0E9NSL7_SAICN|nr:hypothetical protein G7K_6493-t1 [Saitoella complicata NRRL Y-17804]
MSLIVSSLDKVEVGLGVGKDHVDDCPLIPKSHALASYLGINTPDHLSHINKASNILSTYPRHYSIPLNTTISCGNMSYTHARFLRNGTALSPVPLSICTDQSQAANEPQYPLNFTGITEGPYTYSSFPARHPVPTKHHHVRARSSWGTVLTGVYLGSV